MNSYFKDIYDGVATALVGMRVTLGHLFTRSVTIQYPTVKREMPERVRNRLYVNMDDCIGCDQCAKACPVNCITIETAKALPDEELGETSTGNRKRLWVTQFDIDIAKCCYCGLCVFPCPTVCIFMTDSFEFTEYNRNDLVYHFATLTPEEAAEKKENAERHKAEQEAKKKAALEAKKKAEAAKKAEEAKSAEEAKPEGESKPDAPAKPEGDAGKGGEKSPDNDSNADEEKKAE